eukprot:TRINITY_DN40205_c0_g1_i1.p1 TRINITY_DN40205_c0_g1~~TRINITY_DN40205_c0_g1_i1.p1  ORF type:complete len:494 (-),score=162.98 TRINITY_DN40205_c0_g1_i1:97-1578(-)
MAQAVEKDILTAVNDGKAPRSDDLATQHKLAHQDVVSVFKSLEAAKMIKLDIDKLEALGLSPKGEEAVKNGSDEVRTFNAIPADGIPQGDLKTQLGDSFRDGFSLAMRNKWIKTEKDADKNVKVVRQVDSVQDGTKDILTKIQAGETVDAKVVADLKKRKLVSIAKTTVYIASKGPEFALERKRLAIDLTAQMIIDGSWETTEFKPLNFQAMGKVPDQGYLHPLLKVREAYRQVFLEMGFEEMPTNNFVESSFYNFDTLFQPQSHPARDMHDTFFVSDPENVLRAPRDYVDRVSEMHTKGGHGSIGWRYDWQESEAAKLLMRTHTTAVSSRMLYKLAQDGYKPKKFFSIDRVFRNETPDATHLAEFHQIEGVITDRNLTLGDLIGVLEEFFHRIGIRKLRFKPAYNPYTEPSMEIFGYHPQLKKWVEIGNSGVFRPEMLLPMGLPPDASVIAWGLSLERPTMIKYGITNIRELVGHKVDLNMVRNTPVFRLDD